MRPRVLFDYNSITHYEILGVPRHATMAEVREAYLQLVKIYHPDQAPMDKKAASIKIFQLITNAYATLSKSDLRRVYDLSLQETGNDNYVRQTRVN